MRDRIEEYILRLVEESTPEKTAWNQERNRQGQPATWNYIDGCMLKGVRLGILGPEYASAARKTFDTLSGRLAWKDGKPELGGICLVAGLGPEDNRRRDGSFEYYISEPVVANDAKGIAPFVLCYTELRRAGE